VAIQFLFNKRIDTNFCSLGTAIQQPWGANGTLSPATDLPTDGGALTTTTPTC
jgi:hypothetical protein